MYHSSPLSPPTSIQLGILFLSLKRFYLWKIVTLISWLALTSNPFSQISPWKKLQKIASEKFFNSPQTTRKFTESWFRQLLTLATKDLIFLFNDKIYSQIDGVGMGNPLGPTFANLFLSHHELNWLQNCPNHFKPKFYRRYVDDTFILFSDASHVPLFLEYLNSQHPNIKFTHDLEKDGKLNFLDVTINRIDDQFSTSVYRKPTFTGLGLRFDSFTPRSFKINLISCLIHRAYKISSSYRLFHLDLSYLRKHFSGNLYPQYLFDLSVRKYLDKMFNPQLPVQSVQKLPVSITLPYLGPLSIRLSKDLNNIIKKFYPQIQFRCLFNNKRTISSFFPFKDQIPLMVSSNIIYKYSCGQCQSIYIGETKRHLISRICEHKGISFRTNRPLSNPSHSNIRQHAFNCDHPILTSNFSLLSKCPSNDLKLLESIYIHKIVPSLNNQNSSCPLNILNWIGWIFTMIFSCFYVNNSLF